MRITSAEFVTSAVTPTQYPADLGPEIAFVGRSNVGKSYSIDAGWRKPVRRPARRARSIFSVSTAN
jgi:GTP-binding protein